MRRRRWKNKHSLGGGRAAPGGGGGARGGGRGAAGLAPPGPAFYSAPAGGGGLSWGGVGAARPRHGPGRRYLRSRVSDPRLRAKLTPDYPIGGKRIIFDSHYYSALSNDNVELITAPITRIVRDGLRTEDGAHHQADVIIYATGFRAPEFLVPVTVRGRGGALLHDRWRTGPEALLGVAVPGYPNAFLIAGPNSFNPAGSNPGMKEHQIDYIIRCLRWRDRIGAAAIEVRAAAMRAHQQWIERAVAKTVWPVTGRSWYKHDSGRVTNPWPASARTFERALRRPPSASFCPVPLDPATSDRKSPDRAKRRNASAGPVAAGPETTEVIRAD
ncbi:hypothetical protein [Nocardia abscessus]|uniref:hypothetical protein n=1 Tax=Nocardia abscessus TaxID=120957 RepID=UPI00245476F6|nr:hypothetical protein [Nocardia abscessus]